MEILCAACKTPGERHPAPLLALGDSGQRDSYQTAYFEDARGAAAFPGVTTNLGCVFERDDDGVLYVDDFAIIVHLIGDFGSSCYVYALEENADWALSVQESLSCAGWF